MEVVHMLQEICLRKFFFKNVKIAQILLLSTDYFALYRMQKINEEQVTEQRHNRTARHKDYKQLFGSCVLRFDNGQVVLLDLNSGFSIPIFEPTEDGQIASDIAISVSEENSELEQIVILTNKGRILCFDIKLPIPPVTSDETDEKTLLEISTTLKAASSKISTGEFKLEKELPESSTSLHGLLAIDNETFSSFDAFNKLWSLTRLNSPFVLTQSLPETSNWSSLLANEIQVHAPLNWVDTTIMRQRRSKRNLATFPFPCSSTSLFLQDDKRCGEQGALHNTRTIWSFSRVEETTFPIAAANIADQNLVFEFSMPPIMPISHIDISLGCNNNISSTFTQSQLGGQLTIWLLDNDAIKRLSSKINSSSSSFSVSHNKQMILSLLGEKPANFVEENAKCVYGPIPIEQIVPCNINRHSNVVNLRISISSLLFGAVDLLQKNVDKPQSGWLNQPLHFFIHYKPPECAVNEGLNIYKTSTGKSLNLRQQQQTRLLERFGIFRSGGVSSNCCPSIITPASIGAPLKRSHPGCDSKENSGNTKVSPPFYYPASSVKSSIIGSKSVPTMFSLRAHFCSTYGLG